MRVGLTMCALFAMTVLDAKRVAAQIRDMAGATTLHVRVHVTSLTTSGDTSRVTYVVENLASPGSGEDLWQLLVDAPSPPIHVDAPAGGRWQTKKSHRDRATVRWTNEPDALLHPGASSPPLVYTALGVPGLVQYWAVPDLETHPPVEPLKGFADSGVSVGIVPIPRTFPVPELLSRLRRLVDYSCGPVGWVSEPTLCQRLRSKLDTASTALRVADTGAARDALGAFIQLLDAQGGDGTRKHASGEAYALLRPNAVYVRKRLGG